LERSQLRRLKLDQVRGRLHAVESLAFQVNERVDRAVVGLGGRRQLETGGHAHDEIAGELVGIRIAPAQRVADESHALRKPGVLELPSQLARKELRDLVLEAFARA